MQATRSRGLVIAGQKDSLARPLRLAATLAKLPLTLVPARLADGLLRVAKLLANETRNDSTTNKQVGKQQQQQQPAGSTIGPDTPATLTEVNLNVATYIKFDAISNALVEPQAVRASKLADFGELPAEAQPNLARPQRPRGHLLETSFDVHMTLGKALEQLLQPQNLQQQQQQQASPFATPTLGEY